jgi:hypothetical protein
MVIVVGQGQGRCRGGGGGAVAGRWDDVVESDIRV